MQLTPTRGSNSIACSWTRIGELSGKPVSYAPITEEALRAGLAGAGLPPPVVDLYASFDRAISQGLLAVHTDAVQALLDDPTTARQEHDLPHLGRTSLELGVWGSTERRDEFIARRLLRDEVPNCKLGTLARHFRFQHTPTHRALDDALATGDLLHVLLDRARALGVTGLDDLRTLPKMANHAQAAKLRLTDRLPREPGVYLFREPSGKVLYVGKATNLRSRVRSYFSTDDRRKIGPLLREMGRIDFKRTSSPLEAAVLEIRLIHHLEPHYNREGTRWRKSVYVKLTAERFPRLTVVKQARDDGATYLGPIGSRANAALVVEAIETVVPLRRCTATKPTSRGPCIPAQLGVALCLCDRAMTPEDYAPTAALARRCLTTDPGVVIDALTDRMRDLAAEERFEEAAATRDRLTAYTDALQRQRLLDRQRSTTLLEIEDAVGLIADGGHGAWGERSREALQALADTVLGAAQDHVKALTVAQTFGESSDAADHDEFVAATWRVLQAERRCDELLRSARRALSQELREAAPLQLANELAAALEAASDALLALVYGLRARSFRRVEAL